MKHFRLWAACLALLPLAVCSTPVSAQALAAAPSPAAPVLTGTITKISVVGLKNVSLDTVQPKLTLKPGDVYTPAAAQKDGDAIKGMGVFHTVNSSAAPAPTGGVALTYIVAEYPIVQSIKFTTDAPDGKPSVPFSELFSQMKTRVGQVLNTNVLVKDLDSLFNHKDGYAFKQGYIVDASNNIDIDPKTGVLTIPLVECYIKSIEVTGNSRVKTADILAQMHTKVGDLYSGTALNEDEASIYEMGEFRQVENYISQSSGTGKVSITIPVLEQPTATGHLDEKQGKVIPFLYDPIINPYPVIQVRVNGHTPLPFVLDTGTDAALVLNPWAAKQLGLSTDGTEQKGNGFAFRQVFVHGIVLQGLGHTNNVAFDTRKASVVDLDFLNRYIVGQRVAGIVGLGMLRPVTSRFDFAAKTVTIFTSPHPPLRINGAKVLPLIATADNLLTVRATLALDTYASLIVDTGSNSTQLPLSALKVLHPTALAFGSLTERIDGIYSCPELRLPNLILGTLQIPDVVVETLPPPTRLSLGMDILAGYRVTLDGPNGQLLLEPAIHNGRYVSGRSGAIIKPFGNDWIIDMFRGESPAQQAGLRIGDKLVKVDGISVQGRSKMQTEQLLAGISERTLQVMVRRGQSQEIVLSWLPLDDFSAPSDVITGLTMEKSPGGSWTVVDIVKDSPGDKAGLQVNDQLTKMNSETTATMSLDRFAELAIEPVVLLEVARVGVAQPFTVRLSVPK